MTALSNRKLTTNISSNLFDFIVDESKKLGVSQRKILEKIIEKYKKEKLKQQMIEGYNQMEEDKEEMQTWKDIANNACNIEMPEKY